MELSDIELKNCDTKRIDAPIYANTIISTESVAHTTTPKSGHTGENEGHYEKLRLGTKQTEANRTQNASRSLHWEDIPNRIKYAVYVVLAVIVFLFVVDIVTVVIVLIVLPKSKVDGNWIQWSPWSNCDVTCYNGTQTRMRFCIVPAPSNGGKDCSGKSVDTKHCENDGCSVDGNWIQWSTWSNCDFTCNNRNKTRMRFCINPAPSNGGKGCSGKSVDTKQCENDGCSVDGNWIQWSPWSDCDTTCNYRNQTRMRFCINPAPSNGGKNCSGKSVDTKHCEKDGCSVDGNWIQWSVWSDCDVTCNNGTQTRIRFCINPAPSNGGKNCSGKSVDTKQCENDGCSVDGNWIQWSTWSNCDFTCNNRNQTRMRFCINPAPLNGGKDCSGKSVDTKHCENDGCSDGGWSNWSSWGTCSYSCDGGVQSRLRTCTNPRPSLLGRYCDGSSEQLQLCNRRSCFDGSWSRWSSWGLCSDNCDGGVQTRLRTCTNPRPSLLGRFCDGSPEQVKSCNKQACSDHRVAFTAYGSTKETSDGVIRFSYTHLNIGDGYNSEKGIFTCKVPGIYNFAVTLTHTKEDDGHINAFLRINDREKLHLYSVPGDQYKSYSASVAGNFHLREKDFVDVYGDSNYFDNKYESSFTGVLVIPDD